VLDGLSDFRDASVRAGSDSHFSTPPLPGLVTNLLDQLGVPMPGTPAVRPSTPTTETTAGAAETTDEIPGAPGEFIAGSFNCAAGMRKYKLYIPKQYSGKPLPLVMMLHGCTQNPDDFSVGTRANLIADEMNCFVVYPAQTSAANSSKCWNWFQSIDQHAGAGEPAILAGITRKIMSRYAVDKARVFVAGLSAGGAMAAIMGAAYPDLFAVVGVHSGLPTGLANDLPTALAAMRDGGRRAGLSAAQGFSTSVSHSTPTEPLDALPPPPMIVFHGDEDKTVHPRNAEALIAQCVAGRLSQRVEETGQGAMGRSYTRTRVLDSRGNNLAELWRIHHAGHAWTGGDTAGSYTDPKGPDATRAMLAFFLDHPGTRT
jgi:poly(hydroxyalkanoate) depolymerase family esterase